MKTILKSLFVAALFVGIGATANAQTGVTTSTSATARILKQITLAVDTIQFGTVSAGAGQTFLSPIATSASTNVGFNSRVGKLRIDATPQEPIRVEFDSEVKMWNTVTPTADTISYVPVISAVHQDRPIDDASRALSVLVSDQPIVDPLVDVTGPTGSGQGPFCLVTTTSATAQSIGGAPDRVTLYLGGYLYQNGTTNAIDASDPTGTFRGTLNFNVLYAN